MENISERLKQIDGEVKKHRASIERVEAERERLEDNLANEKKRAEAEVAASLEQNFADTSAGGLVDRLYRLPMSKLSFDQLRGNLDRLDHSLNWHRSQVARLTTEKAKLQRQTTEKQLERQARICVDCFSELETVAKELFAPFYALTAAIVEVKRLAATLSSKSVCWTNHLSALGMGGWKLVAVDSILPALPYSHPLVFLERISMLSMDDNPFADANFSRLLADKPQKGKFAVQADSPTLQEQKAAWEQRLLEMELA